MNDRDSWPQLMYELFNAGSHYEVIDRNGALLLGDTSRQVCVDRVRALAERFKVRVVLVELK